MESRIPLPTDNIYKFYALFGLALFLFAFSASLLTLQQVEARSISLVEEYAKVAMQHPAPPKEISDLKSEITDRLTAFAFKQAKWTLGWYGLIQLVGAIFMVYGFHRWHKQIQPIQDEMLNLQLEKLQLEVQALRSPPSNTAPSSPASGQSPPAST